MPDTSATNDTLSTGACGLSLQASTTVKPKDEATPTDVSALASLPEEIQEQIFGLLAEDLASLKSLMQTSRNLKRVARPFCYRTRTIFRCPEPRWQYRGSMRGVFADRRGLEDTSMPPSLDILDQISLRKVRVLHLHCGSCLHKTLGSNQSVISPSLRILHTYNASISSFCRLTMEIAPKLQTVMLHSEDALGAWNDWCQSETVPSGCNRMIFNWWGVPPATALQNTPRTKFRDGATLESVHILLHPQQEDKVWDSNSSWTVNSSSYPSARNFPYENLIHGLMEICLSEAQSIVISGTDRTSALLGLNSGLDDASGQEKPSADILQMRIQAGIRGVLEGDGLGEDKIEQHLDKIQFMNAAEYIRLLNRPGEVGGRLSEYMERSQWVSYNGNRD